MGRSWIDLCNEEQQEQKQAKREKRAAELAEQAEREKQAKQEEKEAEIKAHRQEVAAKHAQRRQNKADKAQKDLEEKAKQKKVLEEEKKTKKAQKAKDSKAARRCEHEAAWAAKIDESMDRVEILKGKIQNHDLPAALDRLRETKGICLTQGWSEEEWNTLVAQQVQHATEMIHEAAQGESAVSVRVVNAINGEEMCNGDFPCEDLLQRVHAAVCPPFLAVKFFKDGVPVVLEELRARPGEQLDLTAIVQETERGRLAEVVARLLRQTLSKVSVELKEKGEQGLERLEERLEEQALALASNASSSMALAYNEARDFRKQCPRNVQALAKHACLVVREALLLTVCLEAPEGLLSDVGFEQALEKTFMRPVKADMRAQCHLARSAICRMGRNRVIFDRQAPRIYGDTITAHELEALFDAYSEVAMGYC